MSEILFQYEKVNPTTWAYLSSLLMIGLYFKFSRFWSVRNLDLLLLILLAPGLLLTYFGQESALVTRAALQHAHTQLAEQRAEAEAQAAEAERQRREAGATREPARDANSDSSSQDDASADPSSGTPPPDEPPAPRVAQATTNEDAAAAGAEAEAEAVESPLAMAERQFAEAETKWKKARGVTAWGYMALLFVGGIFLVRLLLDPTMARRPLLEPNLSTGGLIFIACSMFVFLMANVITSVPTDDDLHGPRSAVALLSREALPKEENGLSRHGPGYAVLNLLPSVPTMSLLNRETDPKNPQDVYAIVAKVMAILSHFAVVFGIVVVGYRHFDNLKMGIGAAALYLMLPYTALMTGRIDHILPAALLLWAVVSYRRPLVAGIFIGLAAGVVYYPVFLLPLWLSFYWQRGIWRFLAGVSATLGIMILSLMFVSSDWGEFQGNVQKMFGLWFPARQGLGGIWGLGWDPVYRLPVLAAFIAISGTLAIWPAQKNLGTLLSCSAAIMVATQFWHPHGGGIYVAWYLPLMLLTIFRPNLEDRVALTVLAESWFARRDRKAA
ncbi:MAG: glycosyltransferase family 87 protein [Pirellulales bacterium]